MTNDESLHLEKRLKWFVNYYHDLANHKEYAQSSLFEWHLGLHISKRILHIYITSPKDLSELKLLVKILDLGDFGSGWMDLGLHANALLNELSNSDVVKELNNLKK